MECCEAWGGAELAKDIKSIERYSTRSKSLLPWSVLAMVDNIALITSASTGVKSAKVNVSVA
jgi:hypothetical protein